VGSNPTPGTSTWGFDTRNLLCSQRCVANGHRVRSGPAKTCDRPPTLLRRGAPVPSCSVGWASPRWADGWL
jgi:hypothetical protein